MDQPSPFMAATLSNGPFARGVFEPAQPALNFQNVFGNLPFLQGPQGALSGMALEGVVGQFLGNKYVPGQFAPQMNYYDFQRRRAQTGALQEAMSAATTADKQTYVKMMQGLTATAGLTWNAERARSADTIAQDLVRFSPMIAPQMGDLFDQLHGSRGSALSLAQNMVQGGRYALDPVTGRMGVSGESAGFLAQKVHENLYGPGADLGALRGLGAGMMGKLYDETQRRGLGVSRLAPEQRLAQLAREDVRSGAAKSEDEALAKLQALGPGPLLESRFRQLEAGRVADKLKGLAGAVSAIKDIFGEAGNPNAPMSQLLEGLQVLTQGALQNFDPQKVERTVRDVGNVARRTGVGMDTLTQLMGQGGQQAQALGVDRSFVPGVSSGAAAFGSAYGVRVGGVPAWGRANKDEMTLLDQQLSLNAVRSQAANQMASVLRLGQDMQAQGTLDDPKAAELKAMHTAISEGKTTYTHKGVTKTVYQQPKMLEQIVRGAGGNVGQLYSYLQQTGENQRVIQANNLGETARDLQGQLDVQPLVSEAYRAAFREFAPFADRAGDLGKRVSTALFSMDPSKIADNEEVMKAAGFTPRNEKDKASFAAALASGRGKFQWRIDNTAQLKGLRTHDVAIQAFNEQNLRERRLQVEEAQLDTRMQTSLSRLGRAGPLERLADTLIDTTPDDTFLDVTAKVLGYIPSSKIADELEEPAWELMEQRAAFEGVDSKTVRDKAEALSNKKDELTRQGKLPEAQRVDRRLRALARAHTGGDVSKLSSYVAPSSDADRAQMRKSALLNIERLTSHLEGVSKKHGLDTGDGVIPGEVKKLALLLNTMPGSTLPGMDSLLEGLLQDERALGVVGTSATGERATDTVLAMGERNRKLRSLAQDQGGGSLATLLLDDKDLAEARTLAQQHKEAKETVDTAAAFHAEQVRKKVPEAELISAATTKAAAEKIYNARQLQLQKFQDRTGADPLQAGKLERDLDPDMLGPEGSKKAREARLAARTEAQALLNLQRLGLERIKKGLDGGPDALSVASSNRESTREALNDLLLRGGDPVRQEVARRASQGALGLSEPQQDLQDTLALYRQQADRGASPGDLKALGKGLLEDLGKVPGVTPEKQAEAARRVGELADATPEKRREILEGLGALGGMDPARQKAAAQLEALFQASRAGKSSPAKLREQRQALLDSVGGLGLTPEARRSLESSTEDLMAAGLDPTRRAAAESAASAAESSYLTLREARADESTRRKEVLKYRNLSDADVTTQLGKLFGLKETKDLTTAFTKDKALYGERGRQIRELTPTLERLSQGAKRAGTTLRSFLARKTGTLAEGDQILIEKESERLTGERDTQLEAINKKAESLRADFRGGRLSEADYKAQLIDVYKEQKELETSSKEKLTALRAPLLESRDRARIKSTLGEFAGGPLTAEDLSGRLRKLAPGEDKAAKDAEKPSTPVAKAGPTDIRLTSGEIRVNLLAGTARFDALGTST